MAKIEGTGRCDHIGAAITHGQGSVSLQLDRDSVLTWAEAAKTFDGRRVRVTVEIIDPIPDAER